MANMPFLKGEIGAKNAQTKNSNLNILNGISKTGFPKSYLIDIRKSKITKQIHLLLCFGAISWFHIPYTLQPK